MKSLTLAYCCASISLVLGSLTASAKIASQDPPPPANLRQILNAYTGTVVASACKKDGEACHGLNAKCCSGLVCVGGFPSICVTKKEG